MPFHWNGTPLSGRQYRFVLAVLGKIQLQLIRLSMDRRYAAGDSGHNHNKRLHNDSLPDPGSKASRLLQIPQNKFLQDKIC